MKIVFWTVSHLPDIGGLQWSTFRLAKTLKKFGHEVLFLTATAKISDFDNIITTTRILAPNIIEWTTKSGSWLLNNISQFDVIHVIDLFYQSVGQQFNYLCHSGLPSVIKIPTMGCIPRIITTPELRYQLNKIDALISLNKGIESELLEVGVKPEKIHYIPNGIVCEEFIPPSNKGEIKKILGFTENDVLVLYVGRLVSRKRLDVLLEVAKRLIGEAKFIIMGSGFNMRDSAEEKILDLAQSISNIYIVKAQKNTLTYYQASDIHILLSEREGQPNSILEGMSCALPTIATNIQGISNLITNNIEGILVNVGDIDSTVAALRKLIYDTELRLTMGENGREKVIRQFEIDIVANQYIELYKSLVENKEDDNENSSNNTI